MHTQAHYKGVIIAGGDKSLYSVLGPLLIDFQSPGHLHCVKRQAQFFTVQYIMCIIMCIAQGQCATAVR